MSPRQTSALAWAITSLGVVVVVAAIFVLVWGAQYACFNWIAPTIVGDDSVARAIYCRPSGSSR